VRVVVVGATGNVGTSVLEALGREPAVESVLGLARRPPAAAFPKTEFAAANVERDDLGPHFRGADAVVHLAWRIQPSRDIGALRRTNVGGSERVFRAAAEARVRALVYASSVGAYSPGPDDPRVDESWPTDGVRTSFYAQHKAQVERLLDALERERPELRIVRLRPAFVFKREAASGVRRLFAGPFVPSPLVRRRLLPFVPDMAGLRFQCVHGSDLGQAYRLAVVSDARGAFNIAAEPPLDGRALGRLLAARPVRVPPRAARALVRASWRLHLQPTPPGWLDLALGVPLMDTRRAHSELRWQPRVSAGDAFLDLFAGIRDRAGLPTPPLDPETGGPLRAGEIASGIGTRE
jgi:UDP-glucose 4-epimerase